MIGDMLMELYPFTFQNKLKRKVVYERLHSIKI